MELLPPQEEIRKFLASEIDLPFEDILGIYRYGSFVYGTNNKQSDLDYILVANIDKDIIEYKTDRIDITCYSPNKFDSLLEEHEISILECFYQDYPLLEYRTSFHLDISKMRHSISSKSSNSWVKAKKKITLNEEDTYIGFKSLFHSFRILKYAIDIVEKDRIDFIKYDDKTSMKDFYNEIMELYKKETSWETLMELYKQKHNKLASRFKELCPKK
jgi:predicted nucleotidyltransferase